MHGRYFTQQLNVADTGGHATSAVAELISRWAPCSPACGEAERVEMHAQKGTAVAAAARTSRSRGPTCMPPLPPNSPISRPDCVCCGKAAAGARHAQAGRHQVRSAGRGRQCAHHARRPPGGGGLMPATIMGCLPASMPSAMSTAMPSNHYERKSRGLCRLRRHLDDEGTCSVVHCAHCASRICCDPTASLPDKVRKVALLNFSVMLHAGPAAVLRIVAYYGVML